MEAAVDAGSKMWSYIMTGLLHTLVVSGCMFLISGCAPPSGKSPSLPHDASVGEPCAVLAFVPYWAQERAVASFERNIDLIDYIAVFWYKLGPKGEVRKYAFAEENRALIERAHQHGVKVLALVANLPDDDRNDDGNWDAQRVGRVIGSEAARAAHVEDLLALTRRMSFDGIYLDYEELPATYRENFTRFVQALGEALHAEDKLLALALHAKTSEDNPIEDNGSAAQDWEALHPHVDQLHFMTYSQHTASTAPGPVASVGWVERVLRYASVTRQVPPGKIYMGVPLYAEEWYQNSVGRYRAFDGDIMYEDAQQRKRKHNGTEKWSTDHESPYIVYRDQKYRKHVIWFENKRSSQAKLALGNALGICQLSLWRLGGEDPAFWDLVREQSPARRRGVRAPAPGRLAPRGEGEDEGTDAGTDEGTDEDEGEGEGEDEGTDEGEDEGESEGEDEGEGEGEDEGTDEDIGDDGDDSMSSADGPATSLWTRGRDHPRLAGETSASVEFYSAFAATNSANERQNWLAYMDSSQKLAMTSRLGLESDVRVVLESDGEDARFYTDFPHEGMYVKSLLLRYRTDRYSVFAGKYELAADIRGHAPIFFGNHSVDLRLDRRLGAGASATLAHAAVGQHTLTGHAFHRDTSRLSGEVFTGRDRNRMYEGSLARTGKPDSFLVTLNGGSTGTSAGIAYTLGWGRQKNGDEMALDEHIYLGALKGNVPLGRYGNLEPSVDLLSLHNAGGEPGSTRNLLLGLAYAGSAFSLGGAYSIRFVGAGPEEGRKRHLAAELLARYEIGRGLWMEAAYQNIREEGEQDNLFGIVLGYMREWLVH